MADFNNKNIESNELLNVNSEEKMKGQQRIDIRVVDWIVGDKHYPLLEKREFILNGDQWRIGKAKGFNLQDMNLIKSRWSDIISALGGIPTDSDNDQTPAAVEQVSDELLKQEKIQLDF